MLATLLAHDVELLLRIVLTLGPLQLHCATKLGMLKPPHVCPVHSVLFLLCRVPHLGRNLRGFFRPCSLDSRGRTSCWLEGWPCLALG